MASKQLFRGLFFCFYPQPSLFRINGVKARAARSFGAVVEAEPSRQTTHILVAGESARSRTFARFAKASLRGSDCAVLDSEWCSQCIDAGRLLDVRPFAVSVPAEPVPAKPVPAEPVPAEPVLVMPVPATPAPREPLSAKPVPTTAVCVRADAAGADCGSASVPPSAIGPPPAASAGLQLSNLPLRAIGHPSSPLHANATPPKRPASPSSPRNSELQHSTNPQRSVSPLHVGSPRSRERSPGQVRGFSSQPWLKNGSESPRRPSSPDSPKRGRPKRARREDAWPTGTQPARAFSVPQRASPPVLLQRESPSAPPAPPTHLSPTHSPRAWAVPPSPLSREKLVSSRAVAPEESLEHPNQMLLDVFRDFVTARQAMGDEYSSRAYERALKILQDTSIPIMSYDDAIRLPNFTPKMAHLVNDVRSDVLPQSVQGPLRELTATLALFETVYGIGPTTARALYNRGCRTLADIEPHVDKNGAYSIAHHADFVERMPRSEVAMHFARVKDLAEAIDPRVQAHCMGSFRRGEPDCGDIDVVLTREGASIHQLRRMLSQLLDRMFATGFADHSFTRGSTRWLGATQVNGKMRRLDILLVPWQELGAAMIYYTGNDKFNRSLRLSAIKQAMRLNEKGLYRLGDGGTKELVESHDERRIFDILGCPWLEPEQRRL